MKQSWVVGCLGLVLALALPSPARAVSVSGTINGVITGGDSAVVAEYGAQLPYGLTPATFAGTPIQIFFTVSAALAPSLTISDAPPRITLSSDGPFVDFMSVDTWVNGTRVSDFTSLVRQSTGSFSEGQVPGVGDQVQLELSRIDPAFTGTFYRQIIDVNLLEAAFGAGSPLWTDLTVTPSASSTGSFEEFRVNAYYMKLNFQLTSFSMRYAPEPSLAPLLAFGVAALALRRRRGDAGPCTTPTRGSRPGRG